MGLFTDTLLKSATDKLARIYQEFALFVNPSADLTLTSGTLLQVSANALLDTSKNSQDYNVEADLNAAFYTVATKLNAAELMSNNFVSSLTALNTHYANNSSSGGLAEYLLATNFVGSVATYVVTVDPWFQDFWYYTQGALLDLGSVQPKPVHPSWRGTAYTDAKAMGQRAVGGAFADGYAVDASYGAALPVVEVTTNFSGGGAPPTITLAGTDEEGTAQTWTATVTGGNNPTSAVATTITPAITTAAARLTVAVASVSGIVAGAVATVNAGLSDQETVLVESVNTGAVTITAVFRLNHAAGAALTLNRSFACAPGVANKRMRDLTNITIGITGHAAGTVRVTGVPERVAI